MKRALGLLGCAIVVLIGGGLGFLLIAKPERAAPSAIRIEPTPQRIERGRYLVEVVADCGGCHSPRDFNKYTAPAPRDASLSGFSFPVELGFPGVVHASNITTDKETGIGAWSDGEKLRALREGVSRDGHALFGFMPYGAFAHMSDEDAYSVIAYLNTLPAVKRTMPRTKLDFPVSLLNRLAPKPVTARVAEPDRNNAVAYGKYLAEMATCIECHSVLDKGAPVAGKEFAGGHDFRVGPYVVNSANITPDEETGIGKWSEARFIARFRANAELTYDNAPRSTQASFTVMNWGGFAKLTDADLKALYAYLRTVPAVHNPVDVHPAQAN